MNDADAELIALVIAPLDGAGSDYEQAKFFEDALQRASSADFSQPSVAPELLRLLGSSSPAIRRRSWYSLEQLGWQALAEATLLELAESAAVDIAVESLERLSALENPEPITLERVRRLAVSDDGPVSGAALLTLCGLFSARADSTLAVFALLDSPDWKKRLAAVKALGRAKPRSRALMHSLVLCLKDPDDSVRTRAAEALGAYRERAAEAVPALEELRNDRLMHVRDAAEAALKAIRSSS